MILSYKSKNLEAFHADGTSSKLDAKHQPRIKLILDALAAAKTPGAMNFPGSKYHPLKGFNPTRYAVSVNASWRITFEFDGENACRVDYEQYH